MNNRIVVLTGSFNPVTKAHYKILSDAVELVKADKGLFIATTHAYLTRKTVVKAKSRTSFILSQDTRKKMLESLNKENPKLFFGGFEIGGASPATDKTLNSVIRKNKGCDIYYLCGADKLHSISHWTNVEHMFSNVYILVYSRSDIDVESIINSDPFLLKHRDRITIMATSEDIEDISSTEIRRRFFASLDYSELMNPSAHQILKELNPSDFKPLTSENIIEATIRYDGRHSQTTGRVLVYKENTNLFKNWDKNRFGSKEDLINHTKVYDKEFKTSFSYKYETEFDCQNIDCSDFALNLIKEGYNPAILNLASGINPCGGYSSGAGAQEEALCQMSTLSVSLYQFASTSKKCFKDGGYKLDKSHVYPLNTNFGGIYTPEVVFFRNNINEFYSLRDEPFRCSVISVPSLAYKPEYNSDYFDEDGNLNEKGLEVEKNKIRTIYRIALDNHHDSVVLGAFGCGAYHLKPEQVAPLFKSVLEEPEFKNNFRKIAFAIYEGKGSYKKVVGPQGKFKPFYVIFA